MSKCTGGLSGGGAPKVEWPLSSQLSSDSE